MNAMTKMLGVIQAPVLWRILWLMTDWKAMLDVAYHAEVQDIEDLVDESDLLSISSSSEGEVEVCEDALSMQGVGQPFLDQHVEVHYRVRELVCSRRETSLAIDVVETGICAACERGITCKEEGTINLVGDEVWDQFLSCLSNDMVIEQVFEEQIAKADGQEFMVEQSSLLSREVQVEGHVLVAKERVGAKNKVLKVFATLLIKVLLQVAFYEALHRLQSFVHVGFVLESPLAKGGMIPGDAIASNVGVYTHFGYQACVWIHVIEDSCYGRLPEWLV
ncbi:hypothetical protein GOP47_0014078 [Adiantum capillus-veneris]|uniref:Uncharacterized protein n=1 Tax=Adiantum capillus-veneris TaxID=13818 RepID=A0A9D4ZF63_ADICA|nr:hypothetical protein GOP47_0014078 [Adiantum capillus-veneris]